MKGGGDPSLLFHEESEKKCLGSIQTLAGDVEHLKVRESPFRRLDISSCAARERSLYERWR